MPPNALRVLFELLYKPTFTFEIDSQTQMSYPWCNSSIEHGAGESGSHPEQELGGNVRLGCSRIQPNLYMSHQTNIDVRVFQPDGFPFPRTGAELIRFLKSRRTDVPIFSGA
jgi:hypothetical protein